MRRKRKLRHSAELSFAACDGMLRADFIKGEGAMALGRPRAAGRIDEMSHGKKSLRVEIQGDRDIILYIDEDGVPIEDKEGNVAKVEFCHTGNGGGRSPHTRRALFALFEALKKDGIEAPEGIPKYPVGLAEQMAEDS